MLLFVTFQADPHYAAPGSTFLPVPHRHVCLVRGVMIYYRYTSRFLQSKYLLAWFTEVSTPVFPRYEVWICVRVIRAKFDFAELFLSSFCFFTLTSDLERFSWMRIF